MFQHQHIIYGHLIIVCEVYYQLLFQSIVREASCLLSLLSGMQALAMRLDLQLSTDQERQLLESCVLHSEAPSMPRRSTRSSNPGSPMRRSASGLLAGGVSRSASGQLGQLLGAPNSVSVLDRQTSFGRQNSFYNVATPPQSLPAIQAS